MKVTDNSTYRLMNTNLDRITNDLLKLRTQGATGIKLNVASDDPSAIRPVLTTRTQIRHTDRYLETLGVSLDKMQSTDSHLGHVESILQQTKEVAINSINSAMSQADLNILADEIDQLKEELLDSANAMVDGKYIFSGYQENTVPFVKNPNYDSSLWDQNNPNTWPYLYQGDAYPTDLEVTPGEVMAVNITGNDLFLGTSNATMQGTPTQPPVTGTWTGGAITPDTVGSLTNFTIRDGLGINPDVVINGDPDLIDTTDNFATKLAGLLDGSTNGLTTGLMATVMPSNTEVSGAFSPTLDPTDTFSVNGVPLATGINATGLEFDQDVDAAISAIAAGDPTLAGGSIANGDAWIATGVGNDIITISGSAENGDLAFSAANGADITITESVSVLGGGFTTASYANATTDYYGTVDISTNTGSDIEFIDDIANPGALARAGLAGITGTNSGILDAANAYPPDPDRLDMFSSITRLQEAIRAGNIDDPDGPGGGISQGIANLETVADQERRIRSRLGNKASRVESATLHQQDALIDLEQVLSRYQDADVIQVYNDIIQKETAFEAALSVTGRVSKISILDYI